MRVLDERRAAAVRAICELIVPGSARVWPEVYIDAVLARMPEDARTEALEAFAALEHASADGAEGLAAHVSDPAFMTARALACEAFYSDFVAPGAPGPGAWTEIDFNSPLARRLAKDWAYLGLAGASDGEASG